MPTLHVRNVPDAVYDRLRSMATKNRHSLSAEVLVLLCQAVDSNKTRINQKKLVERIRRGRIKLPPGSPTPEQLIREDRER